MTNTTKPYHHGDLRRALLDAALDLITQRDVDHLTLREVARRANVSHTAPYRHFPDKAALIEALAVESYTRFTHALHHTRNHTPGTPLEQLSAVGQRYVTYALEHPAQFRVMHRPELRRALGEHHGPVEHAAGQAFDVLRDLITTGQQAGQIARLDPHALALTAWAGVHGLAVLLVDGLLLEPHRDALPGLVVQHLALGLLTRSAEAPR